MRNCKVEFLEETQGKEVLCADISYGGDYWDSDRKKHALLPVGFDDKAFALFLAAIDYDYDAGYGGQEVFGTIWYKDGTWSERGEYDGYEWWEYKKMPEIPDTLSIENKKDGFAYSQALAFESLELREKFDQDKKEFNGVTFDDIERYAKIVAYKVANNLKNGFVMDNNDDPLNYGNE